MSEQIEAALDQATVAIAAEGIVFAFRRRRVLDNFTLNAPKGGIYGLLGRNGAGKTTALKLLMGILRPRQGRIRHLDTEVDRVTPRMRRRVGYVSQEQSFYSWMRVKGLGDFVGGLYPSWSPALFDTLVARFALDPAQRVGELSTGSKMKLAMVLALSHRPALLILDEPTAGVDPVTRREIFDLLKEKTQQEGCTAILSTHDIVEIESAADWVGILHAGRLRYEGPTREVERWFRRVEGPVPAGAVALWQAETSVVARAEPSIWAGVESEPASLEDVFYAITMRQ